MREEASSRGEEAAKGPEVRSEGVGLCKETPHARGDSPPHTRHRTHVGSSETLNVYCQEHNHIKDPDATDPQECTLRGWGSE